jgi:hypothetical protein
LPEDKPHKNIVHENMEDKINRETGNYFPFERKTNGNFAARVRDVNILFLIFHISIETPLN